MSDETTWVVLRAGHEERGGIEVQAHNGFTAVGEVIDRASPEDRAKYGEDLYAVPLMLSQDVTDLRVENRRLRQILDTMTRTGQGKGALIEVFAGPRHSGIVVCRADCNESAFLDNCREAIDRLAKAMGCVLDTSRVHRSGVTAEDPHQDGSTK